MPATRKPASKVREAEHALAFAGLGPCLGCPECRGMCGALLQALTVPEAVLRARL